MSGNSCHYLLTSQVMPIFVYNDVCIDGRVVCPPRLLFRRYLDRVGALRHACNVSILRIVV